MRKKNKIPEYHIPSPGVSIKILQDWSMKNFLIY